MTRFLFRAAALALPLTLAVASTAVSAGEKGAAAEDPVVAIVNGSEIFRSDVIEARDRLPPQFKGPSLTAIYPVILRSIVDRKLVAADARRRGLHEEKEVKRQLTNLEDKVLQRALLERYVDERMTDAAVSEQREKLIVENRTREEMRARHILVSTEEAAKAIIVELADGADFAALAKEKSIGPSASRGGDVGYFTPEKMIAEFAKAAFAMKKGEISKTPVKTEYGWHVIKVEDRRPVPPLPPERLEQTVRATLSREIRSEYIHKLRESATIKEFEFEEPPADEAGAGGNPHGAAGPHGAASPHGSASPHGKPKH